MRIKMISFVMLRYVVRQTQYSVKLLRLEILHPVHDERSQQGINKHIENQISECICWCPESGPIRRIFAMSRLMLIPLYLHQLVV